MESSVKVYLLVQFVNCTLIAHSRGKKTAKVVVGVRSIPDLHKNHQICGTLTPKQTWRHTYGNILIEINYLEEKKLGEKKTWKF